MSRLRQIGRALLRAFGAVKNVLSTVAANVVIPAYQEIVRTGAKTDAERRAIVERYVADYLSQRYPTYAWLADEAVEFVFIAVRERLRDREP
jgi:hypothetical protein